MSDGRLCPAIVSLALLAGCAGDWRRSYHRWNHYMDSRGPYARWAGCIRDRSYHYLDWQGASGMSRPAAERVAGTHSQLFTHVLEDCRELMSGPAWQHLRDAEVQKLLGDAYQAFSRVQADVSASAAAEIVEAKN